MTMRNLWNVNVDRRSLAAHSSSEEWTQRRTSRQEHINMLDKSVDITRSRVEKDCSCRSIRVVRTSEWIFGALKSFISCSLEWAVTIISKCCLNSVLIFDLDDGASLLELAPWSTICDNWGADGQMRRLATEARLSRDAWRCVKAGHDERSADGGGFKIAASSLSSSQ